MSSIEARLLVQDPASALSSDFTLVQSLDYIVPKGLVLLNVPSDATAAALLAAHTASSSGHALLG